MFHESNIRLVDTYTNLPDILESLLQSAKNPLDGLLRAFVTYNIMGLVRYI